MSASREPVELREMRWWDVEPVLVLEQATFPENAWSAGMFWSELAHARGPFATRRYVVAVSGDELLGYGGFGAVDGTGDILTIAVTPGREGKGLGARLLTELLGAATDFGCHEVLLEVRVDNDRAKRLYERFGFAPLGVRRGYYQPAGVDALVMRRPHPPESPESLESPTSPESPTPKGWTNP